jgi:hypothetical protein
MPSYVTAGSSGQCLKLLCILIINNRYSRGCPGRFQIAAADPNTQGQESGSDKKTDKVKESNGEESNGDEEIDNDARSKPNNLEGLNSPPSYVIILSA